MKQSGEKTGQSALPREQYQQRFEAVREHLNTHDLGALLAYSPPHDHKWAQTGHVAWLSGWDNSDRIEESTVVVPASGEPVFLAAGMQWLLDLCGEVSPIEEPVPLNDNNANLIEAGNTVVIHSMFELPAGTMMVPLGDVRHVTDSGPEMLMEFQRKLFVAGA